MQGGLRAGRASGARSSQCQHEGHPVRRWSSLQHPQPQRCEWHARSPLQRRAVGRSAASSTALSYPSSTSVSSSHQEAPANWDDETSEDEEQAQRQPAAARLTTLEDGSLGIFISKTTAAKAAARTLVDALGRAPQVQLRGCGHPAAAIAVKTLGLASAWLQPSGRRAGFTITRQEQQDPAALGRCYCYHVHVALERVDSAQLQGILQKQQEFPVELEQYWRKKDKYALFEERAHELADIIYDAVASGEEDVYAVALTNAQLVTSFESVALAQRRLSLEGSGAALHCAALTMRMRGKNNTGWGTVLRIERRQRPGQQEGTG